MSNTAARGALLSGAFALAGVAGPAHAQSRELSAFLPFSGEAPVVTAARTDPSPENLKALAQSRMEHALALRELAGDDTQGEAFQRHLFYAESAARLDPANVEAWKLYGAGLLMVPDWPLTPTLAEEAFGMALALDPDDMDAALGLGHALFAQQRFDPARTQWERTIQAHPRALTVDLLGPLNMAYILTSELEAGVDFYDRIGGEPMAPAVALAQAILVRQLWRDTADPVWRDRLAALDAQLDGPFAPAELRAYWRDLQSQWAAEP